MLTASMPLLPCGIANIFSIWLLIIAVIVCLVFEMCVFKLPGEDTLLMRVKSFFYYTAPAVILYKAPLQSRALSRLP